jgi:hypothetical protein
MIADLGIDLIEHVIIRFTVKANGKTKVKFLQALKEMKKTLGVNPNERRLNIVGIISDVGRLYIHIR